MLVTSEEQAEQKKRQFSSKVANTISCWPALPILPSAASVWDKFLTRERGAASPETVLQPWHGELSLLPVSNDSLQLRAVQAHPTPHRHSPAIALSPGVTAHTWKTNCTGEGWLSCWERNKSHNLCNRDVKITDFPARQLNKNVISLIRLAGLMFSK